MLSDLIHSAARFLPLLLTGAAVALLLGFANWYLRRRWRDNPGAQFQFQLIMLSLALAALVAVLAAAELALRDAESDSA